MQGLDLLLGSPKARRPVANHCRHHVGDGMNSFSDVIGDGARGFPAAPTNYIFRRLDYIKDINELTTGL